MNRAITHLMKRLLFLIAITVLSSQLGHAQSGISSSTDISKVNIDDLSDAQISSYLERAQQSGMSEQQLLLIAKQRGMSETQIQKLRDRINGVRKKGTRDESRQEISRIRQGKSDLLNDNLNIFENLIPIDSTEWLLQLLEEKAIKIFGSDLFKNSSLNFEPSINIPTPQDYQIGAGDEVIIDIWGASEQSYILPVSPEGKIMVPNIGPIYISGLTVKQSSQKIKRRLSQIYEGLYSKNGNSSNTNFQFSLGNLKSVKVNVIGEVVQPGSYTVSSFSSMFNAIYYAGGPNENGSMRNIDLIRRNKKISSLDVYQYIINGKISSNIKLEDQDVIIVKPYFNRVVLEGEVKRPAIYESIDNETFADLLKYAGGFNEKAYTTNVIIKRKSSKKRELVTLNENNFNTFELKNGDEVEVNKILDRYINRVRINGAVNMPGQYELKENSTLKSLIIQAEGLREDAFLGRGLLIRLNDDFAMSNVSFHVGDLMKGNFEDIRLKNDDNVIINSIFKLNEKKTLSIRGEVLREGDFPFIEGMTVEDLIVLSGGLKESASRSIVEVAQRVVDNNTVDLKVSNIYSFSISSDLTMSGEASTHELTPFDIVTIRKSPGYSEQIVVELEGEVKYPGKYVLQYRNERISDLINRAGGITQFAYAKGGQLIRRTEFYSGNDNDAALSIKKQAFEALAQQDSLVDTKLASNISTKQFETVGIDLVDILKNPNSIGNLRLQEGDIISIPKQLETVRVSGEILYPVVTRYQNNQSLKDYLSFAGGLNDNARIRKAFVIYPNGTAARTKNFLWFKNYPKIEPGTEIIIPRKPERRGLTVQEILSVTTSLITIAILMTR